MLCWLKKVIFCLTIRDLYIWDIIKVYLNVNMSKIKKNNEKPTLSIMPNWRTNCCLNLSPLVLRKVDLRTGASENSKIAVSHSIDFTYTDLITFAFYWCNLPIGHLNHINKPTTNLSKLRAKGLPVHLDTPILEITSRWLWSHRPSATGIVWFNFNPGIDK